MGFDLSGQAARRRASLSGTGLGRMGSAMIGSGDMGARWKKQAHPQEATHQL